MPSNNLRSHYIRIKRYLKSTVKGYLKKKLFGDVKAYCMFIGYQRSGHSLIGALLDAHPNIIMGMEVDVLDLVERGYSRNQILYCILDKSIYFTKVLNNVWTDYSYAVPESHQGKFTKILVMGDKKGGKSTLRLGANQNLLPLLEGKLGCPVKILHIIRNPYDNIATMVKRHLPDGKKFDRHLMEEKIDLYFKKADINAMLCENKNLKILDIYHEEFLNDPAGELKKMIRFLDLDASNDYLDRCAGIVYQNPHLSRVEMQWPSDLKESIQNKLQQYSFLKHYTFDHE